MASKWKLINTEARNDGTGDVAFEIVAINSDGNDIPGRHTTVLIAGADIMTVANNVALTTNQKAQAIKALIAAKLPNEWLVDALDATVAANILAVEADAKMDLLANVFGGYPVTFSL